MAEVADKAAPAVPKLAEQKDAVQKEKKLEKDRLPVVEEEIQGDGGYGTVFLSEDGS
ncbi:hypothetical protein GCK32_022581, partial [Trichostrongylus colubriformis]